MTPEELKQRFPQASAAFIAQNSGVTASSVASVLSRQVPSFSPPANCINVNFESRHALIDWLSDIDHSKVDQRVVSYSINVKPMGAPRMVHSDRWSKSPRIKRYWEFKNKVRAAVGNPEVPDGVMIKVFIPICASASKKSAAEKMASPHTNLGDVDNHAKGILDALFDQDKRIWLLGVSKFWCREGEERIELKLIYYYAKK